jgi:hypothetical protein
MVLNTTPKDNSLYYGQAFGSGNLSISGPLDDVLIDIVASTEKGTKVALTPFGVSDEDENSLILMLYLKRLYLHLSLLIFYLLYY